MSIKFARIQSDAFLKSDLAAYLTNLAKVTTDSKPACSSEGRRIEPIAPIASTPVASNTRKRGENKENRDADDRMKKARTFMASTDRKSVI